MTRNEEAYAMKLKGQLLAHTTRSSPQEVFDEFSQFIKLGGKIVEVDISEIDERPCFKPTAYLFVTPEDEFRFGAITFDGSVTSPSTIESSHPVIDIVRRATGAKFTYDSIFLFELDSDDVTESGVVRMAISFNVTEDGDTTTVARLVQKNGIQPLIHNFLEPFNF